MHREHRTERDRVSQSRESLGCGHADALFALAPVELRRLAGLVPQGREYRASRSEKAILACGRRELGKPRAEDEPPLEITGYETMMFQSSRESVSRRAGEPGRLDESGQSEGSCLERPEHGRGFVEDSDSASVVHVVILPSQHTRWQVLAGIALARV